MNGLFRDIGELAFLNICSFFSASYVVKSVLNYLASLTALASINGVTVFNGELMAAFAMGFPSVHSAGVIASFNVYFAGDNF